MEFFVTDENFNNFSELIIKNPYENKTFQATLINDPKTKKNYLKITVNVIAAPAIYYKTINNKFCFSSDYKLITKWCQKQNLTLTPGIYFPDIPLKSDWPKINDIIQATYQYDIPAIDNYCLIKIYANGSFDKTDYPLQPFTVDIPSNYDIFKNFLLKYRHHILDAINNHCFFPTISGGLDTRTLLGLFRNQTNQLNGYYQDRIKYSRFLRQNPKFEKPVSRLEHKIAKKAAKGIGIKRKCYDSIPNGYITIHGGRNDISISFQNINDPEFVYKVIQHYINLTRFENTLFPYCSDEYLQFKQERHVTKALLAMLLIPDLLDIPFISISKQDYNNGKGLLFYHCERYREPIIRAKEIMQFWGTEKCANILQEN